MYMLNIGTKDAMLAIAIIIILGLTIFYHWSVAAFIITECTVCFAFWAGSRKQDKRLEK
ncbi:hypothetical protein G9440_05305 [Enterococcus durans]|uniref:hypothetical protein n=1 Tax=Enterococcus durans TaxID=53345 RepID=UPI00187E5397|nr:hypothetical protein [Enterococcus durans]MBE8847578.1 hypothetical protein [Enterococcus durans]